MSLFERLKLADRLFGRSNQEEEAEELTNQALVDQLEQAFRAVAKRESFDNRLIYDCSYLILMRREDYNRMEVRLPQLAEGIVRRFYHVIKEKKQEFPHYNPISNYWYFQFVGKEAIQGEGGIAKGKVEVISAPVAIKQEWGDFLQENLVSSRPISVSLNGKHSKYSKFDMNLDFLNGVDVLDRGKIRIRFHPSLDFDARRDQSEDNGSKVEGALARLTFEQHKSKKTFNMTLPELSVGLASQPNESSTNSRLNIYEPSSLDPNHFKIKYEASGRLFYIALFSEARVNEIKLPLSPDQDHLIWHRLKQHSKILCGLFQIEFEALK